MAGSDQKRRELSGQNRPLTSARRYQAVPAHWDRLGLALHAGASFGRLPELVGHPLAEIAVFGLVHKLDAGSAVGNAVAIENGQVHQLIAKDVADDRGERLSAVNVRKAIVAGKAGRREPQQRGRQSGEFWSWKHPV
jgi:hypothetical protein